MAAPDAAAPRLLLVTGAAGKVGTNFIASLLAAPAFARWRVRALLHSRALPEGLRDAARVEEVRGSMASREDVRRAAAGATHVLHLATCKETDDAFDVSVKGFHFLVEECRASATFAQLILLGGDAGIGHFVYPRAKPVTEDAPHSAYKGVYALSKVLEEVILQQAVVAYGFRGCCLRAPWIMEKDDWRFTLSWGADAFGGPKLRDVVGAEAADAHAAAGDVAVLCDEAGVPLKRSFLHVDDLCSAILAALDNPRVSGEIINIAMDEPLDYAAAARVLTEAPARIVSGAAVHVRVPFHSVWLDNCKAKLLLGEWRPKVDARALVERSFAFQRAEGDRRVVYYPG